MMILRSHFYIASVATCVHETESHFEFSHAGHCLASGLRG